MSTEANKAFVRRFYEDIFNQRNLALVDELCTTNHVFHNPPTTLHGREEFKQLLSLYITAFPDARFTVEDSIAEGDRIASRYTFRGTHQGKLMGIAPTGKQVTVTGIIINRIAGGQSAEGWLNFDALGMLQQLGVVPPPGQAS
jgi:predicted ester cyclase